jgi:hypothetical protein
MGMPPPEISGPEISLTSSIGSRNVSSWAAPVK